MKFALPVILLGLLAVACDAEETRSPLPGGTGGEGGTSHGGGSHVAGAGGQGAAATGGGGSGIGGAAGGAGGAGGAGSDCEPDYPSPEISVADHGAVGDGVTDDTTALRAALGAVATAGGTVRFEAGKTYLVSDKLELWDATGFALRGNGAVLKVAAGTPTDDHCPLSFRGCSSFAVANLTVDGNRDNRTPDESWGGHNIRLIGVSDFSFCRVTSDNATTDGFYLGPSDNTDSSTFPEDGQIQDCHADNNFRQGLSIINGRRLQVIDSSFTNTHGTAPESGIDIEPNPGSADPGVEDVLLRNCLVEGNAYYGLSVGGPAATNRLTVEGCTFRANGNGGMLIASGWTLVRDNLVEDHEGWTGIHLRDATRANHVVIRGNTLRNNIGVPDESDGWLYVNADSGTDNFVLENVFENNSEHDLWNNNPAGACAAGNLIDGQLDAPLDSCGAPPDVGYGTGP